MEEIRERMAASERVVAITHTHADLDTVGSTVGIAATLDARVDIATPDGVKPEATELLDGQSVVSDPGLDSYDLQVVVDAPSQRRIAPLDPVTGDTPLVVIDHHEPGDLQAAATVAHIDTDAPATALLVTDLLRGMARESELPPTAAAALAAGILDDTGFRVVLDPERRDTVFDLLERSSDRAETLAGLWDAEPGWSERVATTTALARASGYKAGRTIVLVSSVGGEESAAVQTLLDGNADIGVVLSPRGDRTRVVARTAPSLEHDLSLPAAVLEPLVAEFGGHAGGHESAGVAKLDSGAVETVERRTLAHLEERLGMQFGTLE